MKWPQTDISEKIKNNVRKFIDYEGKVKSGGIVDAYACISDEIAPVSDAVLFSEEENERFISNEASVEAVSDETSTFSEGGEIEPIIAQGVHYGESGVNPASGNFSFSVVDFNDYSPAKILYLNVFIILLIKIVKTCLEPVGHQCWIQK